MLMVRSLGRQTDMSLEMEGTLPSTLLLILKEDQLLKSPRNDRALTFGNNIHATTVPIAFNIKK